MHWRQDAGARAWSQCKSMLLSSLFSRGTAFTMSAETTPRAARNFQADQPGQLC